MKKGFTLVELLAVIVILAIILAIAVPGISGIVKNATQGAFKSDAKMILKTVNYKLMEDDSLDIASINETNIGDVLKLSTNNYETVTISTLGGKPYVVLVGKNKWSGLVAYGSYSSMSITDSDNYASVIDQLGYNAGKGVNEPKLTTGMTPIKWNGTEWITTTEDDSDWYNYDTIDKKWANAKTSDGSMWVWIPRYVYKISSNWHVNTSGTIDVQFSKGIDDNWNNSVIGNIDTDATSNASNNKWTNHPAFTFGATELTGVWMGKFETTASEGVANGYIYDGSCPITDDNVTTKTVKIVPNATPWRCIQVGNAFTVSRNMETNSTYGWGTSGNNIDTHLMKNIEWGAIAYLSKSNYGQGANEIWVNAANDFTTGCSSNDSTFGQTVGCLNAYYTTNGVKASATGTIYGVYDLSGGAWEETAAYVDNANDNLNTYGASIISADSKYKDIYQKNTTDSQANNYALTINKKGDAVYETSNNINGSYAWFYDFSYMPNMSSPWFERGAIFRNTSNAGPYSFGMSGGEANSYASFRSVLLVGIGL